jgi:hypothetical protein
MWGCRALNQNGRALHGACRINALVVLVDFKFPITRLIRTLPPTEGQRISEAMMSKRLCGFDVIFIALTNL